MELVSLQGWGHRWPGPHFTEQLARDDPLRGFDVAELMWAFLEAHTR